MRNILFIILNAAALFGCATAPTPLVKIANQNTTTSPNSGITNKIPKNNGADFQLTTISKDGKEVLTTKFPTASLPENYIGSDPAKIINIIQSTSDSLKKGEYETSKEYNERVKNSTSTSKIRPDQRYAFRLNFIQTSYDADTQTYQIGGKYGQWCQSTYSFGQSKGWTTCRISKILRVTDSYTGSNAYGATRSIERERGRDASIALKTSTLPSVFSPNKLLGKDDYSFTDNLYVPLEKARTLKDKTIGVLFVGNIISNSIVEGRGFLVEPKINNPKDIIIIDDGIPFNLTNIVYYVIQTGEIVGLRYFD